MKIEDFKKKWDEGSLKAPLAMIIDAGCRAIRRDAESYGEEAGASLRAAAAVSKDLQAMPWDSIRYIVKRML